MATLHYEEKTKQKNSNQKVPTFIIFSVIPTYRTAERIGVAEDKYKKWGLTIWIV